MPFLEKDLLQAVQRFPKKKAVLFDMDGVIFDTERLFMEQLAVIMKEYGYHLTRRIYQETLGTCGKYLQQIMQSHYGKDYPFAETNRKANERVDIISETVGLTVKPQIETLLHYLKEKEILCAIASSSRSDRVGSRLRQAGIDRFFREIVGGEMVKQSKPEPDIFLLACERLNCLPEECLVLEDSENGVRAAYAAGCTVICIPDLQIPSLEVQQLAQAIVLRE